MHLFTLLKVSVSYIDHLTVACDKNTVSFPHLALKKAIYFVDSRKLCYRILKTPDIRNSVIKAFEKNC